MPHKTLLALVFIFSGTTYADASDPSVRAVYGDGVHSFYAGNFQQSYNYLSQVIDIGTDDPRVYYFRGLSALRLGSKTSADEDFRKGATFEAERGNTRSVSRALERIQGPDRFVLEQSRSKARLVLAKRQEPQLSSNRQSFLSGGRRYSGIGGTESQENLSKQESEGPAPTPVLKSTDVAAETVAEPEPVVEIQPMQTFGAEKAQRDSDAFFGKTNKEESEMTDAASGTGTKKTKTVFDDPFGDDPFADGPRRTDPPSCQPAPDEDSDAMSDRDSDDPFKNFAPRRPTGSNTQRDQIEMQNEMLDAEAADSRDQREAMNERDAAAGD